MADRPLRIIFFGTAEFAVPPLKALASRPDLFTVVAVVTQPDKPAGRHGELRASPVASAVRELNLPLLQPPTLKDTAAQKSVADLEPDLFVVAAYGKILPKSLLTLPKFGPLNLHGSLLPAYRGASPIQAAILAGETMTGVTLMVMDEQVDHGPVVADIRVTLAADDTHLSLEKKLGEAGATLLLDKIQDFVAGKIRAEEQDHSRATFTRIIDKNDGLVRWSEETAEEIYRKLRAYDPWPGVFAIWRRGDAVARIKILKVAAVASVINEKPGTVTVSESDFPQVCTKSGRLELVELQMEGKKPMTGKVFLNGYRDFPGAVLASGD